MRSDFAYQLVKPMIAIFMFSLKSLNIFDLFYGDELRTFFNENHAAHELRTILRKLAAH